MTHAHSCQLLHYVNLSWLRDGGGGLKYSEASSKFLPWFALLFVTLVRAWKLLLANDRTRKHGMKQNLQAVVSLYERERIYGANISTLQQKRFKLEADMQP